MKYTPTQIQIIVAVSMVSAIGGLVFNTMPLLLGALSQTYDLSAGRLGTISLYAGLGYLLGTLCGPLWVDKVPWRKASMGIVGFSVLSFLLASAATRPLLPWSFAGFGFFCALAIALAMRVLAELGEPEKAYGIRLSVELISIGVFLGFLPVWFIKSGGFSGAMHGLAGVTLLLGLGTFLMPSRPRAVRAQSGRGFPAFKEAFPGYCLLGIFLVYLLTNVGLFFFLAIIAQSYNPTPEQFGIMFSVLKWLGGVAGLVGAVIGARLGKQLPHILSLFILLLGVAGLFSAKSMSGFMVASWVWEFGFTLGCLYQTAAIVRYDPSGKQVVLVPAAFGVAMLLGGKIAGSLLEGGTPRGLYLCVILTSVLPAIFVLTWRKLRVEKKAV